MKVFSSFIAVLVTSLALIVGGMDVAEAKRLGGGKSFGGKFNQSQNVKRNSADNGTAKASPAQTQNAAAKQNLAGKGGMMGLLGGLAIGGLLGALFFGGAFEGFNFFDFAMIALFAFVAFKLFGMLMRRQQPATAGGPQMEDHNQYRDNSAGETGSGSDDSADGQTLDDLRGAMPKNFDKEAFLDGAKNCFVRLQHAWDEGDLADIRQFASDHVFGEIQDQLHNRIGDNKTEIVDLQAELLKINELDSKSEAVVLFTAKLSENGREVEIGEVWHFSRPNSSLQPTWLLEGIQQVED